MSESPTPPGRKAPVKDEIGLLEVLRLLIDSEKAQTTSDLLKYATQYGAPEAEERLRVLEAENVPVELAFDSISVHLRLLESKRNSSLLAGCRDQKVGLILPMPPHLPDLFTPISDVTFLEPGELGVHSLAPEDAIRGSRAYRLKAQEMFALVFEAYREEGGLFVDVAVADVLNQKSYPLKFDSSPP